MSRLHFFNAVYVHKVFFNLNKTIHHLRNAFSPPIQAT